MNRTVDASVIYMVTITSFCHLEDIFFACSKVQGAFSTFTLYFKGRNNSFAPGDFIPLVQRSPSPFCLGLFFMSYKRTWEFLTLEWEFGLFKIGLKRTTDLSTERALKFKCKGPWPHTHKHPFAHSHPVTLLPFEQGAESRVPHLASSPNLLLVVPSYS